MKYIILSVALVSLLFSCDNPYNKESEGLNNLLQEFNPSCSNSMKNQEKQANFDFF